MMNEMLAFTLDWIGWDVGTGPKELGNVAQGGILSGGVVGGEKVCQMLEGSSTVLTDVVAVAYSEPGNSVAS